MGARNTTKARRTPAQSRSQATVDAILTATAYVFADRGFAHATTNRIAEVAGVNVGTLYRYFPNKDALVGALIDREAKATLDRVEHVLSDGRDQPLGVVVQTLLVAMVDERRLDARVHKELVEQVGRSGRVSVLRKLEQDIAERLFAFIQARSDVSGRSSAKDARVSAFLVLHTLEAVVHAVLFLRPSNISRDEALEGAARMVARFFEP